MFQFNLIPLILKPKTSLELHFDRFFFSYSRFHGTHGLDLVLIMLYKKSSKKISIFNFSHAWHATNLKLPIYTINSYFFPLQIKNQPRLKVKSRIVKTLHKKVFETEKKISYPQIMYLSWSLLYFQPFYFVREDVSTKVKKIKVKLLYSTCMYHPNKKIWHFIHPTS